MTQKVYFKRGKDSWETPSGTFDPLNEEFGFTLDVCASHGNAKCGFYITTGGVFMGAYRYYNPEKLDDRDGLAYPWMEFDDKPPICWMNPPYSSWGKWVQKASEESGRGATVVALLPARTDTIAFHKYIYERADVEIRFIKGRVKFVGAAHGAPFPSMIVVFRPPSPSRPTPIEDNIFKRNALVSYPTRAERLDLP